LKQISKQTAQKLFEDHADYVFKTAYMLTRSTTMADDITQDTFLRIFEKFHTYDGSKPIKPWLYRVTLNVVRNAARKQKWLSFFQSPPDRSSANQVEDLVLETERERALAYELERLSLKSKEMIVLHFYHEFTLTEISAILSIPVGTCKSRLHTALNALRKQLPPNEYISTRRRGVYE